MAVTSGRCGSMPPGGAFRPGTEPGIAATLPRDHRRDRVEATSFPSTQRPVGPINAYLAFDDDGATVKVSRSTGTPNSGSGGEIERNGSRHWVGKKIVTRRQVRVGGSPRAVEEMMPRTSASTTWTASAEPP